MGYSEEDADPSLWQYRCTNVIMRLAPSFFVTLESDSNDVSNILMPVLLFQFVTNAYSFVSVIL